MLIAFLAAAALGQTSSSPPSLGAEGPGAIFTDNDYPVDAIRKEEQGTVAFRLRVTSAGGVENCAVTASSGSASLDAATCRILSERAKLTPATDASGKAIAGDFDGRIRWVLPEITRAEVVTARLSFTALRAITNIWEVTAGGEQRSCRREYRFESGETLHMGQCLPLDRKFVKAAAAYLAWQKDEIVTLRLDNFWLVDPTLPWPAHDEARGELLVRGESDYHLADDQRVQTCTLGRALARINWRTDPCFRRTFSGEVPAGSRDVRMAVQWVVQKGPDTGRPAQFPWMDAAPPVTGEVADRPEDRPAAPLSR